MQFIHFIVLFVFIVFRLVRRIYLIRLLKRKKIYWLELDVNWTGKVFSLTRFQSEYIDLVSTIVKEDILLDLLIWMKLEKTTKIYQSLYIRSWTYLNHIWNIRVFILFKKMQGSVICHLKGNNATRHYAFLGIAA